MSAKLTATTDPTASRQMLELERALAQLHAEQRQVILLVGLEGMSYQDAAGILRIPVGTVRSRLSRGRDALRKLLDMDERRSSAALQAA
jgi:RNA polymerase sigma-70 factor, ECF subfamily